jgi:acyl carrier protein
MNTPRATRDVARRLRHTLASCLGLAPERPSDELAIAEILLAAEDLDELAIIVESEFGIRVPDFALERIRHLGDLARVVGVCLWVTNHEHSPGLANAA